jgi:hypothetical protein
MIGLAAAIMIAAIAAISTARHHHDFCGTSFEQFFEGIFHPGTGLCGDAGHKH